MICFLPLSINCTFDLIYINKIIAVDFEIKVLCFTTNNLMETSTTPKVLHSRRSRSLRPSPSSSFKSPLIKTEEKKVSVQFENASKEDMKKATLKLWEENEDLKKEICELEQQGYEEGQLKWYINKLHEYNEIKDVAQMVMGRIAVLEQKTAREVHEDFGMKDDD